MRSAPAIRLGRFGHFGASARLQLALAHLSSGGGLLDDPADECLGVPGVLGEADRADPVAVLAASQGADLAVADQPGSGGGGPVLLVWPLQPPDLPEGCGGTGEPGQLGGGLHDRPAEVAAAHAASA